MRPARLRPNGSPGRPRRQAEGLPAWVARQAGRLPHSEQEPGGPRRQAGRLPYSEQEVLLSAERLRSVCALRPNLAVVLGSGFQSVIGRLKKVAEISYAELPGFPPVSVEGHAGTVVLGYLGKTPALILSGRGHYYEGHAMEAVTFPVRVLAEFGVRDLLLTNAAGGIIRRFRAGDFMLLTDHINFMPANPLRGALPEGCSRFVDLCRAYDTRLNRFVLAAAKGMKIRLQRGVYMAVPGPCYETPAEIRAFARLGADAIGMSTVPEVIVARQCGLAVAGLSCITNLAAGRSGKTLCHSEVLAAGKRAGEAAGELLYRFAELYAQGE